MKLLITICARGGSKGIPGKNIKHVNGIPLIGYSIRTAMKFATELNADIALSTDDPEIRAVAESFGLKTEYLRPAALATDTAGKIDVLRDLLQYEENKYALQYDYVLDLDVTSPLRTTEDLETAFQLLRDDPSALNLFSVSKAGRNPYFNMVEQQDNGYYGLVKKLQDGFSTRQSAPAVYDMNASFYFYRKDFFTSGCRSAITDRSLVYVMPHTCFDLDEPLDFEMLDYLVRENKLNFEL
jgi:N-acylneuraminate cytidylyltransferase